MKWFKHDSNASSDAKILRVRMKYGMEGYGLYWHCLELIVGAIDESNLTFELEHDAEIISHQTGIHYERVQEMMAYMVEQGLFENRNGNITCMKLLKRLDKSMSSNHKFRAMLDTAKENHDSVMTESDSVMQDKTRKDKTRLEQKTEGHSVTAGFDRWWSEYPKKVKKKTALEIWRRKKPDPDILIADVQTRLAKDARWKRGFVPDPTTYLTGERWNDEIETPKASKSYAEELRDEMIASGMTEGMG